MDATLRTLVSFIDGDILTNSLENFHVANMIYILLFLSPTVYGLLTDTTGFIVYYLKSVLCDILLVLNRGINLHSMSVLSAGRTSGQDELIKIHDRD